MAQRAAERVFGAYKEGVWEEKRYYYGNLDVGEEKDKPGQWSSFMECGDCAIHTSCPLPTSGDGREILGAWRGWNEGWEEWVGCGEVVDGRCWEDRTPRGDHKHGSTPSRHSYRDSVMHSKASRY